MMNLAFLAEIRAAELDHLVKFLPDAGRILEFGAGTGQQARMLSDMGYDVLAIDLAENPYEPVFPIQIYDGRHIPADDHSVDAILSSNVLEHVEDLPTALAEFKRVLKPGGVGVHAMPSPAWRAWTLFSGFPNSALAGALTLVHVFRPPSGQTRKQALLWDIKTAAAGLLPIPHGVGSNAFAELVTFSEKHWRSVFQNSGFAVQKVEPSGLFYTGSMLFNQRLSLRSRERLAQKLGHAAKIYVVTRS